MSAIRDPLQVPLTGIVPVSASAGTGKTFTIATLYLRLILERGLKVDEIVLATFTRAAAAELATRLAERLWLADTALAGNDPQTPQAGDSSELDAVRKAIGQALAHTNVNDLRARAHAACLAIDTACIGTLHGFFHQALREFGFEAGSALRPSDLIDDARALEDEILRDFWRQRAGNAADAALLTDTWGSPEELARQVRDPRWRGRVRELPEPEPVALQADFAAARARIAKWSANTLKGAQDALADCVSYAPTLKKLVRALTDLHTWAGDKSGGRLTDADAIAQAAKFDARAIDKLKPAGIHAEGPAFDDLAALCDAHEELVAADAARATLPQAKLLAAAREFLDAQRPARLAERHLVDHDTAIDMLADALQSNRGAALVKRLQGRWKAALVDEFQDTDSQQYAIVRQLFGASTLIFVGDPKQAIYGFRGGDVYAWQQALQDAKAADTLQLTRSFRAGQGLCDAFNALFTQHGEAEPRAFIEPLYHPDIEAADGVRERAVLRDGKPLPALQCWWLDPEAIGHAERSPLPSKERVEAAVEAACVAWIANAIADSKLGVRGKDGTDVPLRPKHIAVLVNANRQALSLQAALARAGVPATSNLVASVYASAEAADLSLLLAALAAPDDLRAARAAHASVLIGWNATQVAASETARDAELLERVAAWAYALRRRGPAAWLHELLQDAAGAPRLVRLPDGQRRIANYLQLGELLQDLAAQNSSGAGLADAFARARREASDDDGGQRLRADVDTGADDAVGAVTVSTVHAAKGLEYGIVLVPYAVLGHDPQRRNGTQPHLYFYHEGNAGHVAIGAGTRAALRERAAFEERAEDVRKLYVAITRASALCILPYGPTSATHFSAAYHLLQVAGRTAPLANDHDGCWQALQELRDRAPNAVAIIEDLPTLVTAKPARTEAASAVALRARAFNAPKLERDWTVWSFSRLVRGGHGGDPAPGAGDRAAIDASMRAHMLAGPGFGTAVHAVFERTDFAAWRGADVAPVSERDLIERSLRDQGLLPTGAAAREDAIGQVARCIRGALNAELPCDVRLCNIASAARRAEIEFHLALKPAASAELCTLLRHYGYLPARQSFGVACLNGLLTGKIDLVFQHAGTFHIIDWKTNLCAAYDEGSLAAEIARHEYDLQWLIYTLALHRWLGQRLADYTYSRDVGEAYYLFVRGMADGGGIHRAAPALELITALDDLFHGGAAA